MRKIIVFITLSFVSLFVTNERGICESSCDVTIKPQISQSPVSETEGDEDNAPASHGLKPYDGFFLKL